ncbi:MAG: apolipoprotein N-acyltransferase [Spirochaetales bacterium]|nr:apolipoprotein N-acyltransferase [Spirochaetales bacterium]
MKKYLPVAIITLVVLTEFVLFIAGPMASVKRTSVIVAPAYNDLPADSEQFLVDLVKIVESKLVRSGSFSVVRQSRFEEYYFRHPDEKKTITPYRDYLNIAAGYGIMKLAVVSVYTRGEGGQYAVHIYVKDTAADINNLQVTQVFSNLEELDTQFDLEDKLQFGEKAINLSDLLYLFLLLLQLVLAVLLLVKIDTDFLSELILVLCILMFLNSFFFAKNANMDYFQRFVASKGQVTIAADTRTEQFYAFVRFLPLFLLNVWLWIRHRLKNRPEPGPAGIIRSVSFALSTVSAVLYTLCFPNELVLWGIPVLAWIALVPLFLVFYYSSFGRAFFYGLVFGSVQSILINFWQSTYSFVGLQIVASGLIIEYTLFLLVLLAILHIFKKHRLFLIAPIWTLFEYLRSIGFLGYPWGLAGSSQFRFTPFIQLASITGIWGLSFLILLANAAITLTLIRCLEDRSFRFSMSRYSFLIVACGLFVCNLLFGLLAIAGIDSRNRKAPDSRAVLVIQQNTDPRKHDYQQSLDYLRELTDLGLAEMDEKPALVVWPEGAFKPDIRWWSEADRIDSLYGRLFSQLQEFIVSRQINVVTGTQDHIYLLNDELKIEQRNMNSSALLNSDGSLNRIFHKMKLVPFTEHFPYKKEFPKMWDFLQKFDTSNWLAGWERRVLRTNEGFAFVTPICFEDAFPDHIRRFVPEGVDLIANMSNDYWSLSPVEGLQHGINGLFRAVENRRPMVRSTCSGYTVYADQAGRIISEASGFYEKSWIIADIPDAENGLTIYTRYGDWFPLFLLAGLGLYALVAIAFTLVAKRAGRRN